MIEYHCALPMQRYIDSYPARGRDIPRLRCTAPGCFYSKDDPDFRFAFELTRSFQARLASPALKSARAKLMGVLLRRVRATLTQSDRIVLGDWNRKS